MWTNLPFKQRKSSSLQGRFDKAIRLHLLLFGSQFCIVQLYFQSRGFEKKSLFSTENPRDTFVHSFMHIIESDENSLQLGEMQCTIRVAFTIFNISTKNYALSLNDSMRKSKVSKQNQGNTKMVKISKATRKIKKLQST